MNLRLFPLVSLPMLAFALLAAACEKNNDIVVQEQFRESETTCPLGCVNPPPGCAIKGNISSDGQKFYHLPGTRNYEQKKIQTGSGERWFCTENEAIENGFTRKDY